MKRITEWRAQHEDRRVRIGCAYGPASERGWYVRLSQLGHGDVEEWATELEEAWAGAVNAWAEQECAELRARKAVAE